MTPEPSFESLSYKPFSVDGNHTGLDDKAKMAFCKSFLNHMQWHYIYLLSSSIHLSSSIFTLQYIYLLYVGDIIERDLSL